MDNYNEKIILLSCLVIFAFIIAEKKSRAIYNIIFGAAGSIFGVLLMEALDIYMRNKKT